MDCEAITACIDQTRWVDYATLLATISAVIAAVSAFFSYQLSKNIYDEIKSDETLVASDVHHPRLGEPDHENSVIYFTIFNKSHRKASITNLKVFDNNQKKIDIEWSDSIDKLGNIQNPSGLLGLKDSSNIYIRRNDGETFYDAKIFIQHSFSDRELELTFDPY
jgi:hypothetical protein